MRLDPRSPAACRVLGRLRTRAELIAQKGVADVAAQIFAEPTQQPAFLPLTSQVQSGQHDASNDQQGNLQF